MLAACSLPMPFAIHQARSIQGPVDNNCLHLPEVPGKKGFVGYYWEHCWGRTVIRSQAGFAFCPGALLRAGPVAEIRLRHSAAKFGCEISV